MVGRKKAVGAGQGQGAGKSPSLPSEEDLAKTPIFSKSRIVTDKREANIITKQLLEQPHIAVDCEGVNLGPNGQVTLIQVGMNDGTVFIFDLISEGIIDEVRVLLEAEVLKVIKSVIIISSTKMHANDAYQLGLGWELGLGTWDHGENVLIVVQRDE
jgi:hypothetical protein